MSITADTLPTPAPRGRGRTWPVALAALVGIGAAASPVGLALAAFLALMAVAVAGMAVLPARDRESIFAAFAVGLALRVALIVILYLAFRSPDNPAGLTYEDSFGYHRMGAEIARLMEEGLPLRLAYHTTGSGLAYHHVVARMYALLGASHWTAKLSNAMLGALIVILTYVLARPLAGRRAALAAAWMYALWPTAIYWSAHILKDTLVGILVVIASLFWVRYVRTHRPVNLLWSLLATVPLFHLRIYVFAFLALGIYLALLIDAVVRRRRAMALGLVLLAALGWAVPFRTGLVDDPAVILWKLSLNDPMTAGSLVSRVAGSGQGMVAVLPLAIAKFMISPLPWKAAGVENFVVPGVILQYAILPFAARGGLLLLRDRARHVTPFVVLTVLTVVLYAAVFLGANPRHMHMFYPYMFICAAAGLWGWRHWALPWCLFLLGLIAGSVVVLLVTPP